MFITSCPSVRYKLIICQNKAIDETNLLSFFVNFSDPAVVITRWLHFIAIIICVKQINDVLSLYKWIKTSYSYIEKNKKEMQQKSGDAFCPAHRHERPITSQPKNGPFQAQ